VAEFRTRRDITNEENVQSKAELDVLGSIERVERMQRAHSITKSSVA